MAILRGVDGAFYEVPDDQLAAFRLSDKQVFERQESFDSATPVHEEEDNLPRIDVRNDAADSLAEFGWRNRWGLGWRNSVRTPTTNVRVTNHDGNVVWIAMSQTLGRGDPGWFAINDGDHEDWSRHVFRQVTIQVSGNQGATVDQTIVHEVQPGTNHFLYSEGTLTRNEG